MITSVLKVLLWGEEIGRLSWDGRRKISYFEYNRKFLSGNIDAFPLIASIKNPYALRPIMGDRETKIYQKLPPFVADSLPDSWGNQVFECWRINNNIKEGDVTPLDILSFIGKRGMGALEFAPESPGLNQNDEINLKGLAELAQRIFSERENVHIFPNESLTLHALIEVGTSAGGRQPKAVLAINNDTKEIRSGQIAGLSGFDYYILKFGDATRSSAELEYTYYQMAIAAGINMAESRLMADESDVHFLTKRFDRDGDRKLHVQTLAAMYPDADSYETLLMVCRRLRLPESAQVEVFRRMVFNILANNTDDHNKNFSFVMNQNGKWSLSPAYDLTFIFNARGYLPENNHCLMLMGKVSDFTLDDVITFAKDSGIKKPEQIIKEVVDSLLTFRALAEANGVGNQWISSIDLCINKHLEEWGFMPNIKQYSFELEGHTITDAHLERAYKGNYHILATIDNIPRKYVISKTKEEYSSISTTGICNITEDYLKSLVRKFLI